MIADVLFFGIAGVIAWAKQTMKAGISASAPAWGEFYEVHGDLKLESSPNDWVVLSPEPHIPARHFLFYLRDETFECDAERVEPLALLATR